MTKKTILSNFLGKNGLFDLISFNFKTHSLSVMWGHLKKIMDQEKVKMSFFKPDSGLKKLISTFLNLLRNQISTITKNRLNKLFLTFTKKRKASIISII